MYYLKTQLILQDTSRKLNYTNVGALWVHTWVLEGERLSSWFSVLEFVTSNYEDYRLTYGMKEFIVFLFLFHFLNGDANISRKTVD